MAKEAYEWYEEQQAGLGELFLKELDRCFGRISVSPALHAKIDGNFRQIIFQNSHTFSFLKLLKMKLWFTRYFIQAETQNENLKKTKKLAAHVVRDFTMDPVFR